MKVYLIHAAFKKFSIPYIGESISLNYISSVLKQANNKTKIFDCILEEIATKKLLNDIMKDNPDILFISFYEENMKETAEFIDEIRKRNIDIPIILTGIFVTLNTKMVLQKFNKSKKIFCIRGEAEAILTSFNENFSCEEHFTYWENGDFYNLEKIYVVENIDELPYQDFYVLKKIYKEKNVPIHILSSRGCYGNCSFCLLCKYNTLLSNSSGCKKWRERNIESIVDEIELISKLFPGRLIKFADSNFIGCNPMRGKLLSEEIIRRQIKVKFSIECRSNDVDENIFKSMKDAGLVSVFIGIESGSDEVLKRYNKETSVFQNQRAIDIIRNLNIGLKMGFILFDEYSTINELKKNIEFLHKNSSCVLHPYRPLILQKYCYDNREINPTVIFDEKARFAYDMINKICKRFLPYKSELDRLKKVKTKQKELYQVIGKFICFDEYLMRKLIDLCEDTSISAKESEEVLEALINNFLMNVDQDLEEIKCVGDVL